VIGDYIEKYDALQISLGIESSTPLLGELPESFERNRVFKSLFFSATIFFRGVSEIPELLVT
jgi:hypothetical protein